MRRSLFTTEVERNKFLARLISGTRDILRVQQGLSEHANYHEYCKLLGRLKTNYQLSELVNVENYAEWIQLVAEFTIKSLQSWQWASGSVYYLLGLWSRLVSSMPYLKGDAPSLLEGYVPKITEAYITSRLDSVQVCLFWVGVVECQGRCAVHRAVWGHACYLHPVGEALAQDTRRLESSYIHLGDFVGWNFHRASLYRRWSGCGLLLRQRERHGARQAILAGNLTDDPLDNDEQLQEQLDSLPYLCRFQYEQTSKYLLSLLDPTLQAFMDMAAMPVGGDRTQLTILEGQMTWLVYIVGALIRGRISSACADSQEVIDGELASRIFQLIKVMDTGAHAGRYGEHSRQRLDMATLAFFQNFRKVYVGEHAMHASKVRAWLPGRVGRFSGYGGRGALPWEKPSHSLARAEARSPHGGGFECRCTRG